MSYGNDDTETKRNHISFLEMTTEFYIRIK